jgi:protein-disulfide isomerase
MQTEPLRKSRTPRGLLAYFGVVVCAVIVAVSALSLTAFGEDGNDILSRDAVLRDPEIPALGNPQGDLTVVEFFDYQCRFAKSLRPTSRK